MSCVGIQAGTRVTAHKQRRRPSFFVARELRGAQLCFRGGSLAPINCLLVRWRLERRTAG